MIQLFHVYKQYAGHDRPALSDITLEIERGEWVFLTGASGAGKTSLLRLLFCAEEPTRGQLLINGRNVARLSPAQIPHLRRNIGVVFQDFKLIGNRSALQNVALALEVLGLGAREVQSRAFQMLKHVGLGHKRNTLPALLSGGEQQRIAIARALVNDPLIVLADEPTGNLDPELSLAIMELFEEMNSRGTTVVIATHDHHLLQRFRKRVVHLERGSLVQAAA
jgi:cell division transport system ATP-binding protein